MISWKSPNFQTQCGCVMHPSNFPILWNICSEEIWWEEGNEYVTFKIFCYNAGDIQNILLYRWWIVLVNWKRSFQIYLNWNVRSKLWNPLNMTICYRIHEYVCYSCESEGKLEQGVPFMLNVISLGVQHKILTWNDEAAGTVCSLHMLYSLAWSYYGVLTWKL